jgi:hypothetical protein
MELISGSNAVSTLAFQQVANAAPNVTQIRNFASGRAFVTNAWLQSAAGGADVVLQVKSPQGHDNVTGLMMGTQDQVVKRLMPGYAELEVFAQDNLDVSISDPGVGNVCVESLLVDYENLPGGDARLASWAEVSPRIKRLLGVRVNLTSGGTAGQYGGAVAINALDDQFKANQDYAILGYSVDTAGATIASIGIQSADFANYRLGGPASLDAIETRDLFVQMGEERGVGCIPLFNAANKFNTIVDCLDVATATSFQVVFNLAWLTT